MEICIIIIFINNNNLLLLYYFGGKTLNIKIIIIINNNNIFSNIYIVLDGNMEMGGICEERLDMGEPWASFIKSWTVSIKP